MGSTNRILFLADINSVHTEKWVKSLISKGYKVGVFSLSQNKSAWPDQLNITYECFDLNDESIRSNKRFAKSEYFKAIGQLRPFQESFEPDIIHAHYASSYGMLANKLNFPNTVVSLWGSDIYEFPKRSFLHKFLIKKVLRKAPVVCSTSQAMIKEAKRYVSRSYELTPFGIDVNTFLDSESINSVYTIGTIKSLEHIYGIDRLIKAYAEYRQTSTIESRLKIYGRGSELDVLKKLTVELNIGDHVSFEGFVSGDDVIKAFNSLDVYVALSRRESFGVAILEAQSTGLPVISSDVGGLPEVVDPNSGFVLSDNLINRTAELLKDLEDNNNRKLRSKSARQFVIDNFSDDACVDKLIKVYDQFN